LAVLYVPFLQPVFDTVTLGWAQWELIAPLVFIPAIVAELTKLITARRARRSA
jgi:Ca2+-transporting ATPase